MAISNIISDDPIILRLQELERETDFEFVVELIDIYLVEVPKQIQAIASSVSTNNYQALSIAAHTLKGSSLNLGAKKFGALCLKLEEAGRSGGSVPYEMKSGDLEKEFEDVKAVLNEFKKQS
jgi:histidine phosphotransfer protein HptB